jgi:hypothetical protein
MFGCFNKTSLVECGLAALSQCHDSVVFPTAFRYSVSCWLAAIVITKASIYMNVWCRKRCGGASEGTSVDCRGIQLIRIEASQQQVAAQAPS